MVLIDSKQRTRVRLEVIGTVETYYRAGGKIWHQPKELANAATDRLLDLVEIKNIGWMILQYGVFDAEGDRVGD